MGLFGRGPDIAVSVFPEVVVPRQTVTATVSPERPIGRVGSATLEWGYMNFYRYHWAGRADSAMARAGEEMWLWGDVGSNEAGERETREWVGVTAVDLPCSDGVFAGGTSTFRVPSWAPASSPEIARWSCRVTVARGGRDVDAHGEFVVRVGRGDVPGNPESTEVISGDAVTVIDLDAPPVVAAGDTIRGTVRLTPTRDLPGGDVAVSWLKTRLSHPLTRSPARRGGAEGPVVNLGGHVTLRARTSVALPFEILLPVDATASASAVHSSIAWFVQARLRYAGLSALNPERVQRPIVVVNCP